MAKKNIAIIGAGLSGLSLASFLKDHATISIFEKARGVGGRMSTRYTDEFQFDHGAQFFTARSKSFQSFLKPFLKQNIVQEWRAKVVMLEQVHKPYMLNWFEPHYIASPKMNMLCKLLADKHNLRLKTHIKKLSKDTDDWFLTDTNDVRHGPFDWVVSSVPAPQTKALLPQKFTGYESISNTKMQGCYSLMLGLPEDLKLNWNAAKIKNSSIEWIAVDSSKPSRDSDYSLLVQTSNEWAESHIEDDQDHVRAILLGEAERLLGKSIKNIVYTSLHRWRYANTSINEDLKNNRYFIDQKLKLAACGDWCVEGHVESAFLSARSLALTLKDQLLADF